VIWRLDRLGRSLGDLIELTNEPQSRSIDLESLTEKLDTGSPTGKLVFHVFAALAEFERNLIRERTLAGLKAARARGRQGGRPRKLQPKEQKTIRALLKTTEVSVQEIATRFGVSRSTLYRNKLTWASSWRCIHTPNCVQKNTPDNLQTNNSAELASGFWKAVIDFRGDATNNRTPLSRKRGRPPTGEPWEDPIAASPLEHAS